MSGDKYPVFSMNALAGRLRVIQYYLIIGSILLSPSIRAERTIFYYQVPSPPMPRFNPKMHVGDVYGCAFVDGGETLVTVGKDRTIRLWDARTLKHKRVVYGNTQLTQNRLDQSIYYCVAAHPTRNIIAVAGRLGPSFSGVRVIDLDRNIQLGQENQSEKIVYNVAFSSDGRWLLSGTYSGDINLWELFPDDLSKNAIKFCHMFHTGEVIKLLRFPDDGDSFIYQTSSNTVFRARINSESKQIEQGISYPIQGFAIISPDGNLVAGHNQSDDLSIFDAETADQKMTFARHLHQGSIPCATFSRDGKQLFFPKSDVLWTADRTTNTGKALFSVGGSQRDIRTGVNGLVALVGASPGSIDVVDSKNNERLASVQSPQEIRSIGWGIDHPLRIVWGSDDSSFETGFDLDVMEPITSGINRAEYRRNLTRWQDVRVERKEWRQLVLNTGETHDSKSSILDFSFTQNGKIAYASWWDNGMIRRDSMASVKPDPFFGVVFPSGTVWSVVGNKDLPVFATAGEDGIIQIWHEDDAKLLVNLYVDSDNEWICWTPIGYYDASENAHHYLDWVTDHGVDSLSRVFFDDSAQSVFYRPDVIRQVLQTQTYIGEIADQMGLGIGELEGGVRVNRLPFRLEGNGLPQRD